MRLEVGGLLVADPATPGEIERAVDASARNDDWYLTLARDEDHYIEAATDDDGRFALNYAADDTYREVDAVDRAATKAVLVAYLNGDGAWRTSVNWTAPPPEPVSAETALAGPPSPTRKILAPILGVIIFGVVAFVWLSRDSPVVASLPPPLNDSDAWPVMLIVLAVPVLLVSAVVKKMIGRRRK